MLLFWLVLLVPWAALAVLYPLTAAPISAEHGVALAVVGIASSLVWLNGTRYLGWSLMAAVARRGGRQPGPVSIRASARASVTPRVALLYCTADDLNPRALAASMRQDIPVTTLLLDDSSTEEGRRAVDAFAERSDARVLRRAHRTGFKAGNLNAALATELDGFDYVVVLDSDGTLAHDFVSRALARFAADDSIGVVQGRVSATSGTTAFTRLFSAMLATHLDLTQPARAAAGFAAFLGRGAMISAECLRAAGPIPERVAEDLAFGVEVRRAGFRIQWAPEVSSAEDYPIDYHAFRTQYAKTVEGSIEFLLEARWRLAGGGLRWRERADILLDQLLVPLLALAGVALTAAGVALAALGPGLHQQLWVVLVTAPAAAAPLLPHTFRVLRRDGMRAALRFFAAASALYGSTLVLTLRATARVLRGRRATFHITPKRVSSASRWRALRGFAAEFAAAAAGLAAAALLTGSPMPALPLAGAALAAVLLAQLGARTPRADRAARPAPRALTRSG